MGEQGVCKCNVRTMYYVRTVVLGRAKSCSSLHWRISRPNGKARKRREKSLSWWDGVKMEARRRRKRRRKWREKDVSGPERSAVGGKGKNRKRRE